MERMWLCMKKETPPALSLSRSFLINVKFRVGLSFDFEVRFVSWIAAI